MELVSLPLIHPSTSFTAWYVASFAKCDCWHQTQADLNPWMPWKIIPPFESQAACSVELCWSWKIAYKVVGASLYLQVPEVFKLWHRPLLIPASFLDHWQPMESLHVQIARLCKWFPWLSSFQGIGHPTLMMRASPSLVKLSIRLLGSMQIQTPWLKLEEFIHIFRV